MLRKDTLQALIADVKSALAELYADRLDRVILFGSYAREDFHAESDVDLMVLLKDESISKTHEILFMNPIISPITLEYNVDITTLPETKERFERARTPLLHFVRQEGIEV